MSVNYNKLWKLLIDKGMKKKDLQAASGVSAGIIAKLGKNEDVNTSTLTKICEALECDIGDVVELTPTEQNTNQKTSIYTNEINSR